MKRINRTRDLRVDDESVIAVTITRKRGGRGRVTVVASYDPDEVLGVHIETRDESPPMDPSLN